nr:DMT family transporter [Lonsdalea quercina]
MITFIVIALFNGVCISLSRSINGRLSMERNAFYASLWNHIVGFVFLTLIIVVQGKGFSSFHFDAPFYAYLGGLWGRCLWRLTAMYCHGQDRHRRH